MRTKDLIMLGAGYVAGRMSKKKIDAGFIGAVRKKGHRAIYNEFLRKFWKDGYISDLTKNRAGNMVFEVRMDSVAKAEEAANYLRKKGARIMLSSISKKDFMSVFSKD